MQTRFIKGAGLGAVALAGVALAGAVQAAPVAAPHGHFSVEVIAGPGSISGFNGDTVQFLDRGNHLSWPSASMEDAALQLHRNYRVRLIANPGWMFESISMFAHGEANVGTGTWRAGTVGYSIGDASFGSISSGLLRSSSPTNYSIYHAQNAVWHQYSALLFYADRPLPVPASSFTLDFETNSYLYATADSYGRIDFMGSLFGSGRTWEIDLLMHAVPEPHSYALMLLGLLGLALVARRRPG